MIDKFTGKNAFLSNFFPCKMVYCGIQYQTSEHAYQAAKTNDANWKKLIREADTPAKAKKLGRSKDLPIIGNWQDVKDGHMYYILMAKFMQNPELAHKLLETNNEELVEGNWWGDTYWGIDNKTGEGKNKLGKLLMAVRSKLKSMVEETKNDSD